jgi:hypothetical protein
MKGHTDPAPPFSRLRAKWATLLLKASRAEAKGEFARALTLLDEADAIKPLQAGRRAHRALLLLRSQRLSEAQSALSSLRKELENSDDPDLQYLRRWCTATLGLILMNPAQFNREAREAQSIPCSNRVRKRFPLPLPEAD